VYIGHIGVALAARGARTRAPIALLLLAAQAPDWIALTVALFGVRDPLELWSHSVFAVAAGAAALSVAYLWRRRDSSGAALLFAAYLSHPLLDLLTGRKPPWLGAQPVGACLYHLPALDFVVEAAVLAAGWLVYYRSGRRAGTFVRGAAWWMLPALLGCQALVDGAEGIRLWHYGLTGSGCSVSTLAPGGQ
jgi:hypothetical protein